MPQITDSNGPQNQTEAIKRRLAKQKQQQPPEPEWEKAQEPVQIVGTN